MSAGKGSGRRKGDNSRAYSENFTKIKGFRDCKKAAKDFEEIFMGKQASEEEIPSGKYFMN